MDKIEQLKQIIEDSDNIVFFGGAGVSTESGIRDFRGKNGLYQQKFDKKPEYYLSSTCFNLEPETFFSFYRENMNCLEAKPNQTHYYLTELEKQGKLKAIITQNIDGLHQKADSKNVIEIHGSIYRNYCLKCHQFYSANIIFDTPAIPKCSCGGIIKPDVVLYGEMLNENYGLAIKYIKKSQTFIVAGTSLTVEPAASLVNNFQGDNLIIINNEPTPYDKLATLTIHDSLANVINKLQN